MGCDFTSTLAGWKFFGQIKVKSAIESVLISVSHRLECKSNKCQPSSLKSWPCMKYPYLRGLHTPFFLRLMHWLSIYNFPLLTLALSPLHFLVSFSVFTFFFFCSQRRQLMCKHKILRRRRKGSESRKAGRQDGESGRRFWDFHICRKYWQSISLLGKANIWQT